MPSIGLIGLGEIGRHRHLPTIAASPDFTLAGVADPFADVADFGVPGFRSHGEMLSALPDLDAVAICTPPLARTRVALDAIVAGKHVLVEKPPAATVAEALMLRDAAEAAGTVLFTAWHSQHNEAVARARDYLATRTVTHVSIVWKEDFVKYHPGQEWIWRAGGFGVFDMAINGLSILTKILPQRAYVRAADLLVADGDATPIAARVGFGIGTREGARGEADFDWRHDGPDQREMTITTREGAVLRLDESGGRMFVDAAEVAGRKRTEYPDLYAHFATLLRSGTSDVDLEPLVLACDTLSLGKHVPVAGRG
jgi:D-galactose 1-dehydrogenase